MGSFTIAPRGSCPNHTERHSTEEIQWTTSRTDSAHGWLPEATLVVQDAILIHKHSGAASPIGVVHGEQPKASLIIHNGALLNGFTGR